MSHIKCLNGPAKGLETDIESSLQIGDVVSIPVDSLEHSNGQKYEHYQVSGFIGNKYLLCLAKVESTEPANDW